LLSAEVAPDGALLSLETRESSGRADLDQAAVRAFQASAPFPENTTGRKIKILLPVEFKLPD
jgi:TonB family protein